MSQNVNCLPYKSAHMILNQQWSVKYNTKYGARLSVGNQVPLLQNIVTLHLSHNSSQSLLCQTSPASEGNPSAERRTHAEKT